MRIHHHAIATVLATLILMTMGSLVHGTGSSLACPDWPLCHGSFFPAMVNGVEFEHTHRLIAAGVVLLTGALLARTLRPSGARARGPLLAASALVLVQAVLGGLTVIYRLPPAISIAHLATSMAFLSVLVLAAVRLAPPIRAARRALRASRASPRSWCTGRSCSGRSCGTRGPRSPVSACRSAPASCGRKRACPAFTWCTARSVAWRSSFRAPRPPVRSGPLAPPTGVVWLCCPRSRPSCR